MRTVIVEGMDNSGKSTLGAHLARTFGMTVQESEGPPKYPGEMRERIARYHMSTTPTVFVRHPIISQDIYARFIRREDPCLDAEQVQALYYWIKRGDAIVIYCDAGDRGLQGHVEKAHDRPEHLAAISANYLAGLEAYRLWAAQHAHIIYRIGDDMDDIAARVSVTL